MSLIELNPYGRCTVKIATNNSAAIGKLTRDTKARRSIAKPPSSSVSIVTHAMKCDAGTASACRIAANVSVPLASLAKPCSMKPKPTIRRNGTGTHRAIGNPPGKPNARSSKDLLRYILACSSFRWSQSPEVPRILLCSKNATALRALPRRCRVLQVRGLSVCVGSRIHPAIDGKIRPGDVRGLRTGDERHQRGDLIDMPITVERCGGLLRHRPIALRGIHGSLRGRVGDQPGHDDMLAHGRAPRTAGNECHFLV